MSARSIGVVTVVLALGGLAAGCGGGSSSTSGAASVTSTASSSPASTAATSTTTTTTRTTRTHRDSTTTTTSSRPSSSTSTTTATPSTTTSSTPSSTTTTQSTQTTRTETGPAFVGGGPTSAALTAATALLARHGFTPVDTATYAPADTLHVLIGRSAAGERAFFFNEGQFIGTDSHTPSAGVAVVAHGDSEVTLAYDIYAAGAQRASGRRRVRFALDMGTLSILDPLPAVAARR